MNTNLHELQKTMIPMIRRIIPTMIAQELVGVQPMGNSFNKKYWPHSVEMPYRHQAEIEKWCWQNFRGRYWRTRGSWIAFKREADYSWYMMKWGSVKDDRDFTITRTTVNTPSRPLNAKWSVAP